MNRSFAAYWYQLFRSSPPPNLCAFASLADVAKGGDRAKFALREIFLAYATDSKNRVALFVPGSRFTHD